MRAKLTLWTCLTALSLLLIASVLVAVPTHVHAQTSDILDFFSQELDFGDDEGDSDGEASDSQNDNQDQADATTNNDQVSQGSISDLFGAVPSGQVSSATATGAGASVNQPQGANGAAGALGVSPSLDPKAVENDMRNEAFNNALRGMLPLKPNQIRRLLEEFDRTQESYELPVYPMPKPEFAVKTLSLDPGARPLTVRVAQGHVTTLNFLDVTGAPWPIEDITWAGNFNIMQSGEGDNGIHFVRITPQSEFAYGNMSIKMIGLKTPIIMTMETSRDLVHYRFDAIVPDYGPFAEAPLIEGGVSIAAGNPTMSSVLQGVIPTGAKRMSVSGADSRTTVYRYQGKMYVRTPLSLLSPSWSSSVASADGMRVYTISEAPVLLLSNKGKMVRANVTSREEVTYE